MPDSGGVSVIAELATQVALLRARLEGAEQTEAVRRESAAKASAHAEDEARVAREERAELRRGLAAIERRQDAADRLVERVAALESRPIPASVADVADEVSARIAKRDAEAAQRRPWGQILSGLLAALATALSAWAASQAPSAPQSAPRPAEERESPDMGLGR
jgi:chromosome segregation ATPase